MRLAWSPIPSGATLPAVTELEELLPNDAIQRLGWRLAVEWMLETAPQPSRGPWPLIAVDIIEGVSAAALATVCKRYAAEEAAAVTLK
jgi:hypothetical protein